MSFFPEPIASWKLFPELEKKYTDSYIQYVLGFISRVANNNVFLIDYKKHKIFVSEVQRYSIAGGLNELMKKEDVANLYNDILLDSEKEWLFKMIEEAFKIFRKYNKLGIGTELELSYDVKGKSVHDREVVLHYRLIPYQYDDNGNLWLAFCIITTLPLTHKTAKASIECLKTCERYDFIDNEFVLSDYRPFTRIEIAILGYLADGYMLKQIADKIGMSLRFVEQRKKDVLEKLGATTQAAAVYKAMNMGLI
ncbi:MAG: LuxR C-terminal-related transcriptional regulator [Bacteroidales bacterium]|nr:LuxR C-terminal-related transcriptional regulator [Bacteroidales bacterium]